MFSETLIEHFQSPRNVGEMDDPDAEAETTNPVCGDRLHIWLRIDDGAVSEMRWQAEGCAPALAAASVTSEMVRGRALEAVQSLDRDQIAEALGGLPPRKAHAALLAITALRQAIQSYTERTHAPTTP